MLFIFLAKRRPLQLDDLREVDRDCGGCCGRDVDVLDLNEKFMVDVFDGVIAEF